MVKSQQRSSKYIIGYLSTLCVKLVCGAWKVTDRQLVTLLSFMFKWVVTCPLCLCITFSYITCLNKRNLPKANKVKIFNKYYNKYRLILRKNYKYSNSDILLAIFCKSRLHNTNGHVNTIHMHPNTYACSSLLLQWANMYLSIVEFPI